jgi:hypothetical protein
VKPVQKSIFGFFQKAHIINIPTAAEEPTLCKSPDSKAEISKINSKILLFKSFFFFFYNIPIIIYYY